MFVIRDFAVHLKSIEGFPVNSIPSFRVDVAKPKVGPPGIPRATPRRRQVTVVEEEDVEMDEGGRDVRRDVGSVASNKGKHREALPFTPTSSVAKRHLPVSPTQSIVLTKRSRMRRTKEDDTETQGGRDLSHLVVDEDEVIPRNIVPDVKGQVRSIRERYGKVLTRL